MENAAERGHDMRCWSDLPYDILVLIGKELTIVDHLSFRAVCKEWCSVSRICCPVQFTTESLWLMFLRNPRRRSTQWEIGDPSSGCIYTIDAPLLSDMTTRCLLSKHGWLLLISTKPSPSLFFFNPLSQARIDLPWCDAFSGLNWDRPKDPFLPVFAISSPPTSHDCVVCSVRMLGRLGRYEFCMIGRGENNWKTKRRYSELLFGPILHAFFYKGCFYWNTRESELTFPHSPEVMRDKLLAKEFLRKAFKCISSPEKCKKIITISPTKEGSGKLGEEYQFWVGTLPVGACCASVDGHKLVGWHFWDKSSCPHICGNPRGNNSFWIEPKWSPPSADLKWSITEF